MLLLYVYIYIHVSYTCIWIYIIYTYIYITWHYIRITIKFTLHYISLHYITSRCTPLVSSVLKPIEVKTCCWIVPPYPARPSQKLYKLTRTWNEWCPTQKGRCVYCFHVEKQFGWWVMTIKFIQIFGCLHAEIIRNFQIFRCHVSEKNTSQQIITTSRQSSEINTTGKVSPFFHRGHCFEVEGKKSIFQMFLVMLQAYRKGKLNSRHQNTGNMNSNPEDSWWLPNSCSGGSV